MRDCETCRYFKPRRMNSEVIVGGWCQRYPPCVIEYGGARYVRPEVDVDDTCGEYVKEEGS